MLAIKVPEDLAANYDFKLLHVEHPRVADYIALTWGMVECPEYIQLLITDTRGHAREGFDPHVLDSIMALYREHERRFPGTTRERPSIWGAFQR